MGGGVRTAQMRKMTAARPDGTRLSLTLETEDRSCARDSVPQEKTEAIRQAHGGNQTGSRARDWLGDRGGCEGPGLWLRLQEPLLHARGHWVVLTDQEGQGTLPYSRPLIPKSASSKHSLAGTLE